MSIPIYRAKKIDGSGWIKGHYVQAANGSQELIHYVLPTYIHIYDACEYEVDPKTLAIHFENMISMTSKKIFASLSEDGVGGDTVRVLPKKFVTEGFNGKVVHTIDGVLVLGDVPENEMSNDWGLLSSFDVEVIGIHKEKEA